MNGAVHGYEIQRSLRDGIGSTWRIPTSQLYAQLKRLEEQKLVQSKIEPQDDRPSRRVFELTDLGRKAFNAWVFSPCDHVRDLRIEFLAKIFFVKCLSLDGTGLIKAQTEALEKVVSRIRSSITHKENSYGRLTTEFKLATAEAWLSWLKNTAQPFVEAIETNEQPL